MILFLIWIIPIVVIVRLKWANMKSGTIKDLLKTHVNPVCKECDCCDDIYYSGGLDGINTYCRCIHDSLDISKRSNSKVIK